MSLFSIEGIIASFAKTLGVSAEQMKVAYSALINEVVSFQRERENFKAATGQAWKTLNERMDRIDADNAEILALLREHRDMSFSPLNGHYAPTNGLLAAQKELSPCQKM